MGRSRYKIHDPKAPHFLTCTVLNWLPLFARPWAAEVVLEALQHRQRLGMWLLYGYVIMENHMHLIVQGNDLGRELAQFKSFTARQLIDQLQVTGERRLLEQLHHYRKVHKSDRPYQCWEEGSHPQIVQGTDMLRQKLDYIHCNPVKRGYIDNPVHWRYSSARNYAGQAGLISIHTGWL